MSEDLLTTLIVAVIIMSVLGAVLGGGLFASAALEDQQQDVEMLDGGGTLENTRTGDITNISANSTLGDAVYLTGASDSQVSADLDVTLGDNWSACTYSTADSTVVDNGSTRALLAVETDRYEIVLTYNDSASTYEGYYYDAASRASHTAAVAAPDPTNRTLVCANRNATSETFTVSRNTTVGTATNTSSQTVADRPSAQNWHGTLEETRLYPAVLTNSQRSEWVAEPVLSVEGTAPDARIMYDTRDRSAASVPVYFGGGEASLQNASFVNGSSGPPLEEGEDYELAGPITQFMTDHEIVALDGGVLTGHGDVIFVTYDVESGSAWFVRLGFALFIFGVLAGAVFSQLD
ncbi:hypothetical protein HWV23_02675 [Natronomonas halophila]|uniref:hypothetical protein n=1 Tax=Natronomonas halophila TaxID=2747817 RepID=UPI0015B4BFDE|nr:hypothetical protein [Natronomonas halophila]QLD84604.1 hypothetical protein HWV23_02390 [Natronomonas halophila]QLD84660.1 hypothetical protein HWV23_02675 [Natronomonas halophila]